MKTYFENILPRILSFSSKLDTLTKLIDEPWVVYNNPKEKYFFLPEGKLIYSNKGLVTVGKWQLINSANSILIEINNASRLFNHGFFDNAILMLRTDGGEDLFILANTNKISSFDVEKYIEETYLKKPSTEYLNEGNRQIVYFAPAYNIVRETEIYSFLGSKTIQRDLLFEDDVKGQILIIVKSNKFYFLGKPEGYWVNFKFFYEDEESCINSLHHFLKFNKELKKGFKMMI